LSRRARLAIGAALAAAVVAHLVYGYAPRERAIAPSAPFAALLDGAGDFERVLWIAYPHQNLGAIDEALGDLGDYLAELGRVAGTRSPQVPRFGPFAVPPSRELALAWRESANGGEDLYGVARIYRGLGWTARLAGKVAGNPWLAGGEVERGGRRYRVRWEGALWIVESGVPALGEPPSVAPPRGPRLAEARVSRAVGPLEPGNLRLARIGGELEIRGGSDAAFPGPAATELENDRSTGALRLDLPDLALWVARADRGPVGGPGLFLLWEEKEAAVPRVAVLQRGGGQMFRLPGEQLLDLLGKGDPATRLGWTARGTDRKARREALRIVPFLERNYPRPHNGSAWLAAAGRLAPRRAAGMLDRLAAQLRQIPLLPQAEVARVEAGARLLRPLADCPRVTFEVWRNPDALRVRLCPEKVDAIDERELESSSGEDASIDENPTIR
jgi:hypothetical protein